jgi:hypothetical protein
MAGVTKSKWTGWARQVARIREKIHKVLVGKPEGTRRLATPRLRWEDIIKTDHNEVS